MKSKFRFFFVLVPIAFIVLGSLITMGLWNWLMPALFGLGTLSFIQALGILFLARVLFGWRGFHRFRPHSFAYAHGSCHSHHRSEWMRHRWEKMTPEQREKFSSRCGYHPQESPINTGEDRV
jgi:hypothetical protein